MVEERGEAVTEAAGDDGGGVGEAAGEDRGGGKLVASLVRVVDDYDLGRGGDGLGREGVAETNWAGPAAVRADGPAQWRRLGGGGGGEGKEVEVVVEVVIVLFLLRLHCFEVLGALPLGF